MSLSNTAINRIEEREEMIEGLVKVGLSNTLATKLAVKHFNNEIMLEDLESLKENFDTKINSVNAKIDSTKSELNIKIDSVKDRLNSKIDSVEVKLNSKIDSVKTELGAEIKIIKNNNETIIEKLKSLDEKIDKKLSWKTHFAVVSATVLLTPGVLLLSKLIDKFNF